MKIIFADDDKSIRDIIAIFLKDEGHELLFAEDGKEALSLLENNSDVNIMFVDQSMPCYSGGEVIKLYRQKEGQHKGRLPIIVMTAFEDAETLRSLIEVGANQVLKKPVSKIVLINTINSCGA